MEAKKHKKNEWDSTPGKGRAKMPGNQEYEHQRITDLSACNHPTPPLHSAFDKALIRH